MNPQALLKIAFRIMLGRRREMERVDKWIDHKNPLQRLHFFRATTAVWSEKNDFLEYSDCIQHDDQRSN